MRLLFQLLRIGLGTDAPESFDGTCKWSQIYISGTQQGISAVLFDGLQRLIDAHIDTTLPDRSVKMKWCAHAIHVEKLCEQQFHRATELSAIYARNGIRTVVLKGIVAGQNYPNPNHRPCGDVDCFLMGDYEQGNIIAEQMGAKVERSFYKHSHIYYKDVSIENHQFCTPIRGSRRMKRFERLLQHLLLTEGTTAICNTHLECPSPMFNALFLTHHAQRHFLSEGITLRHLCDWAMFVDKQGGLIDWKQFKSYCEEFGLWLFAESMTVLSERLLNVRIPNEIVAKDDERDNYLLHEIMNGISRHSSSHSLWRQRLSIVKDIFNSRKRYKVFSDMSYFQYICQLAYGYCFDRNPHI